MQMRPAVLKGPAPLASTIGGEKHFFNKELARRRVPSKWLYWFWKLEDSKDNTKRSLDQVCGFWIICKKGSSEARKVVSRSFPFSFRFSSQPFDSRTFPSRSTLSAALPPWPLPFPAPPRAQNHVRPWTARGGEPGASALHHHLSPPTSLFSIACSLTSNGVQFHLCLCRKTYWQRWEDGLKPIMLEGMEGAGRGKENNMNVREKVSQ